MGFKNKIKQNNNRVVLNLNLSTLKSCAKPHVQVVLTTKNG